MLKQLMGATGITGGGSDGLAESVDFDGTNDYLSRSSDFVGNVDSKTFTFSCWVYWAFDGFVIFSDPVPRVSFQITSTGELQIACRNSAGTIILNFKSGIGKVSVDTFNHILVSIDLSSESNRYMYINDSPITYDAQTYTDDIIDFTTTIKHIASNSGTANSQGRLSNVFLDYTYRDLSIESNRRLFITEDLKPAGGLAALNPIMYFPMIDHTTCHINEGTGGDFVQNGVIGQSERGPNQFNATASVIDGSNYLTYSDSATNGTLSYWAQNDGITSHHYSTGAVAISNITTALGDIVGEVFLSQNVIPENKFVDDDGNPLDLGIDGSTPDGTVPSTYFRLRADTPETNDGSGADATIVGGPLVGVRGASEYFSRAIVVDSSNYLTGNIYCESLVKWKSLDGGVTWTHTYSNAETVTNVGNGTDNGVVSYYWGTSENIDWTQEINTLMVTDGLGFPIDMDSVISDNPNSVLALDFRDTDNLGTNKAGTNFTITGTISSGADVNV